MTKISTTHKSCAEEIWSHICENITAESAKIPKHIGVIAVSNDISKIASADSAVSKAGLTDLYKLAQDATKDPQAVRKKIDNSLASHGYHPVIL